MFTLLFRTSFYDSLKELIRDIKTDSTMMFWFILNIFMDIILFLSIFMIVPFFLKGFICGILTVVAGYGLYHLNIHIQSGSTLLNLKENSRARAARDFSDFIKSHNQ